MIGRVKKRIKEGGHNVPENIVKDRYNMSLLYLRKEIFSFVEVYLIENSTETAEQMAIVKMEYLYQKKRTVQNG